MRLSLPPRRLLAVAAATTAAAALLTSCATAPDAFTPDLQATAPRLPGYGRADTPVRTRSAEARRLFQEGVAQAYAFNEVEAVRMFKAALAQDPACALCAWGVAWQLGPNINDTGRDNVAEAVRYVDYALARLQGAPARERDLVEALALRYAHASEARNTAPLLAERCGKGATETAQGSVHPLDQAYADRMRALTERYPQDPDILSLYAEAEMIATPGDTAWDTAGQPVGRMGEVTARLEALLATHPDHTGLNHYLVHAVDARAVAHRAVAAADRLGRLAPASAHLVHMAGHTYTWVGRFDDAVRVNQQALAADAALADQSRAQGFGVSKDWRGHNAHFLWFAAVMAGQEQAALDATRQLGEVVATRQDAFGEYVRSLPLLTLVRFERWDDVLATPLPPGNVGVNRLFWEHARGIAQARLGRLADAQATLGALRATAAQIRGDKPASVPKRRLAMADYALGRLEAEVALARGDLAGAGATQQRAVAAAELLDQSEPPWLATLPLLALADIQARARQWDEAEATYQRSLSARPGNVWAQRGLDQVRAARRS